MRWEPIGGAKHLIPQVVYRWLNSRILAIYFFSDMCSQHYPALAVSFPARECLTLRRKRRRDTQANALFFRA